MDNRFRTSFPLLPSSHRLEQHERQSTSTSVVGTAFGTTPNISSDNNSFNHSQLTDNGCRSSIADDVCSQPSHAITSAIDSDRQDYMMPPPAKRQRVSPEESADSRLPSFDVSSERCFYSQQLAAGQQRPPTLSLQQHSYQPRAAAVQPSQVLDFPSSQPQQPQLSVEGLPKSPSFAEDFSRLSSPLSLFPNTPHFTSPSTIETSCPPTDGGDPEIACHSTPAPICIPRSESIPIQSIQQQSSASLFSTLTPTATGQGIGTEYSFTNSYNATTLGESKQQFRRSMSQVISPEGDMAIQNSSTQQPLAFQQSPSLLKPQQAQSQQGPFAPLNQIQQIQQSNPVPMSQKAPSATSQFPHRGAPQSLPPSSVPSPSPVFYQKFQFHPTFLPAPTTRQIILPPESASCPQTKAIESSCVSNESAGAFDNDRRRVISTLVNGSSLPQKTDDTTEKSGSEMTKILSAAPSTSTSSKNLSCSAQTQFPFIARELKRLTKNEAFSVRAPRQQFATYPQDSLYTSPDSELQSLLNNDETIINKLQSASKDAEEAIRRGALLQRLHRQIDLLEAALMADEKSESSLNILTPDGSIEERQMPAKTFNSWFELYDDVRRNRLAKMKCLPFWVQPTCEDRVEGLEICEQSDTLTTSVKPNEIESSNSCDPTLLSSGGKSGHGYHGSHPYHQRALSRDHSPPLPQHPTGSQHLSPPLVPSSDIGGTVGEKPSFKPKQQPHKDDSHHRSSRRRWPKLFEFQHYIRTQILIHHSLSVASSSPSSDDLRSLVIPHLPPQLSITSRESRRSKLLGRLRTESQMILRDIDEQKRTRLEFIKEVLRHRTRFVEFHGRNSKVTKRLAHAVSRQFAARERKDLSTEAQIQRERLAALRARDEVQYMKLLRETKNQRLLELVKQTENYMNQLGMLVKQHRETEKTRYQRKTAKLMTERESHGEDVASLSPKDPAASPEENDPSNDALIAAKNRYFELAHSIQEDVVVAPSILKGGDLREYQLKGLSWMASLYNNNLNGILADAMGLGKTIQTIALLGYLYEVKRNKGPFLIVAPLSTLHSGWVAEFKRWLPLFRVVIYDGSKEIRKNLRVRYFGSSTGSNINTDGPAFNVLLTTDSFIMKDATHLRKIHWEYLIVDEAHRLKNPQSKLVQVLIDKRAGRGFRIKRRLALTGTPLQNDLQEVWALLNFLMPTIFNSSETFKQWFNAPLEQTGSQHQVDITEEEQLLIVDRLHKVLRPFLLRREKKEVENEVPQKHEEVLWCPMSGLQQKLYRDIDSKETPNGVSVASNTLMQLRKVFLSLRGWLFLRLDGGTSSEDRLRRLSLFNQPESPYFIFLLSTKAGGLGVNLQTADTVIIYDSDWNPQNDEQAQSRAHRIGQTREVLILRLVTADTVEERILTAAGIKLDKDALVIKSGMFYDSHHDLEDERRNKVRAILSKKKQRQAATFYEHGAVNRILARTEEELFVFSKVDRRRKLLGLGDLILQPVYPPILNRMNRLISPASLNEWRTAYSQDCPWTAKNKEPQDRECPKVLAERKLIINRCILRAINEACSPAARRFLPTTAAVPFMDLPDPIEHPSYLEIISQPMCFNHIKTFAERQNFSSLITLEKYLARICSNCRLFNGPDHTLFHQALHVCGVVLEVARCYCCEEFAELDKRRGIRTPNEVQKIKKTLQFTRHLDVSNSSDEEEEQQKQKIIPATHSRENNADGFYMAEEEEGSIPPAERGRGKGVLMQTESRDCGEDGGFEEEEEDEKYDDSSKDDIESEYEQHNEVNEDEDDPTLEQMDLNHIDSVNEQEEEEEDELLEEMTPIQEKQEVQDETSEDDSKNIHIPPVMTIRLSSLVKPPGG